MTKAAAKPLCCPFCGQEPTLYFGHVPYPVAYVRCDNCKAQSGNHYGKDDREAGKNAMDAWNARVW